MKPTLKVPILILTCLCNFFLLNAQDMFVGRSHPEQADEERMLMLKKTSQKITLDGVLEEAAWHSGIPARNFWENFPTDSMLSKTQTEVYMVYDDQFLYVAAKCYASGKNYIVPSLKRDFRAGGNDNITFLFDPFKDNTNAFVFGMNPLGVMREALISNGGQSRDDFNESWDNRWEGVSRIYDDHWVCEMAIPFSTLRFNEGSKEWYFNCYRFDTQSNTRTSWNRIPQNQLIMSLGYMGRMLWEEPLEKTGANISVIPYVNTNFKHDIENGKKGEFHLNAGGDAKIGVTSGLNLDLTFNPDFSQVEVDEQVINLDRFEVFFPERRQFFLENADLFGSFGFEDANPFFSRRIGVAQDTATGNGLLNPIYYGARLSGKLDNRWRLGFLNMQAAKDEVNGLPSYNYTVAALQRKVFSRSNVGLIFVNKQTFSELDSNDFYLPYNRVAGLDYNLASKDNKWTGKVFYHQSFLSAADDKSDRFAHGANIAYQDRQFRLQYRHQKIGENYSAEVGFVPRTDFFKINPAFNWFFYPTKGSLNNHGPGFATQIFWRPEFGLSDRRLQFFWEFNFNNSAMSMATFQNDYTYLFEEFDPTGTDAQPLPAGRAYRYSRVQGFYFSDTRKKFSYFSTFIAGQFFTGKQIGLSSEFTYRYQPYGQVSLNVNYNYIRLPAPYATATLILIGPRIDLTFSKKTFFTTFIQYNNQIKNININTRFQWRFAPVSDFFLVYTDNYSSDAFIGKGRTLVAKLTCWLNI